MTVEQVVEHLHRNAATAQAMIRAVIPRIPAKPGCTCHEALKNAILTERRRWPARVRRALAPMLDRYA